MSIGDDDDFSVEEFEPTPGVVIDDDEDEDDDAGGTAPGAGHNRRGKASAHAKVGEALLGMMHGRGQALRNIHDLQNRTHFWYSGTGSGRCCRSRTNGSTTRSRWCCA